MKTALILLGLVAAFAAGFGYGRWYGPVPAKSGRKVLYYVDPMHPAYKSDKPGIAPDCGMKLEPVYEGEAAPAKETRKPKFYRDPTQPGYTSDKPGINPETGNDLQPVYEETLNVSPEQQHLIGVKYATVEESSSDHSFRAPGKIAADESRIGHVHSRTDGWLESVEPYTVGQYLQKGAPVAKLYSPELYAAQQEYQLALKARSVLQESTLPSAKIDAEEMVKAARRKLELWDLSPAQIEKPVKNVTIYSQVGGYITARNASAKQRITSETELFSVIDLSRIWVIADVAEADAALVKAGEAVTITSPLNGNRVTGRVLFTLPQVDPTSRTLKVRIETSNPGNVWKPEMFVETEFHVRAPRSLTVPRDAVMDTGLEQTVFVDKGNGVLEPRKVSVGQWLGDRVEIRSGLQAGERIVASGTFLIDAETRLKAGAK